MRIACDPIRRNMMIKKLAGFHSLASLVGTVFPLRRKNVGTSDRHIAGSRIRGKYFELEELNRACDRTHTLNGCLRSSPRHGHWIFRGKVTVRLPWREMPAINDILLGLGFIASIFWSKGNLLKAKACTSVVKSK